MGHPDRPSLRLTALLLSVFPALATAQEPPADDGNRLDTVTVSGTRLERDLADLPGAATVVDARQTQQGQPGLQLDESLARVPGLYLQNRYNFAQGLRLSSRGFGARAPFGVRGLQRPASAASIASDRSRAAASGGLPQSRGAPLGARTSLLGQNVLSVVLAELR